MIYLRLFFLVVIISLLCVVALVLNIHMVLKSDKRDFFKGNTYNWNGSFKLNSSNAFKSLKSFYRLQSTHDLSGYSTKLNEFFVFFKDHFKFIHKSKHVQAVRLKSCILYRINGNISKNPYLISVDLDTIFYSYNKLDSFNYTNKIVSKIGTAHSKNVVMSIMEALDLFLQDEYTPARVFYIIFLRNGPTFVHGASMEAYRYFKKNKIYFDFVIESPGVVLNQSIYGVNHLLGIVGITRKGYVEFNLRTHKSRLSDNKFANFINTISKISHQQKNMFEHGIEILMLEFISQIASYPFRLIYSNEWFFKPFLSYFMAKNAYWKTIIQTRSRLININFDKLGVAALLQQTIHFKQVVRDVIFHNRQLIDQTEITLQIVDSYNPKINLFDYNTYGFRAIKNCFKTTFKDSFVIPGDSLTHSKLRNFELLSKSIYHFSPTFFDPQVNQGYEMGVKNLTVFQYGKMIEFYFNLFQYTSGNSSSQY